MEQLKIPKERISVLIGVKGSIKRKIQRMTKTRLIVNSEDGDIFIEGDSLDVFNCLNVVKAIARGFNPDIALKLLDEDTSIEIISLDEFSRSKKDMIRLKSRLIGTQGRARSHLEELTSTNISVYGKTISIIGRTDDVFIARQGIINLINGSKHGNVYLFIEKQKKKRN